MGFQPVKCNMMQLTNKRSSKIQANYTLEGTVLENVESIKYLGVTITNDLKWNTHISNVCTKANRTLGFFCSGVSKLFGAQGSPSSGSLLNLLSSRF